VSKGSAVAVRWRGQKIGKAEVIAANHGYASALKELHNVEHQLVSPPLF
jgi:hypothetical protein